MRNKPSSRLLNYKAQAVAQKNDTITLMSSIFTEDDYEYIRKVARQRDASGLERKRKEALSRGSGADIILSGDALSQRSRNFAGITASQM
jgi:hypothetical protein